MSTGHALQLHIFVMVILHLTSINAMDSKEHGSIHSEDEDLSEPAITKRSWSLLTNLKPVMKWRKGKSTQKYPLNYGFEHEFLSKRSYEIPDETTSKFWTSNDDDDYLVKDYEENKLGEDHFPSYSDNVYPEIKTKIKRIGKEFLGKRSENRYFNGIGANNFMVKKLGKEFIGKRANTGSYEKKLGKEFVGKRLGSEFIGKRLGSEFIGKRLGSEFIGKRLGSEFIGKRLGSEFIGKRLGSEFIGKRLGSEFIGKRLGSEFIGKRLGSEFPGKRLGKEFLGKRDETKLDSDTIADLYLSQFPDKRLGKEFIGKRNGYSNSNSYAETPLNLYKNFHRGNNLSEIRKAFDYIIKAKNNARNRIPASESSFTDSDELEVNSDFESVNKRLSEFLGGPGKRLSEFLGGPGKRVSEFLGGPGKRTVVDEDDDFDNYMSPENRLKRQYALPGGSEFLGGPGRKRKRSYITYPEKQQLYKEMYYRPSKRLSEFLGGPGKRFQYSQKRLSEFLGGPGKRVSEFLGGPGKRLSEFLGGPGKR